MNWRAAWSALRGTSSPAVIAAAEPDRFAEHRARGVSEQTLWEADRRDYPVVLPETTFARYQPMKGILPAGIAMDSAFPPVNAFNAYAVQGLVHEGLVFLGYPYLAQLTQRPEYRRAAEIRAEHATRKWVKWTGHDDKKLALIDAEMKRLQAKEKFRWALENDGFFGRAQIFPDFGDFDKPKELDKPLPLVPGKISTKRPIKSLRTVEPMWCYPAPYESANPLAPTFYKPSAWYIYGRTVHDSRLLTFVGNEVPDILKPAYAFGGLSLSQMMKPYVDNWLTTRQSVADMISAFSILVLYTEMGNVLQGGSSENVMKRIALANKLRNNRSMWAADKATEEIKNLAVPLTGLEELQAAALTQLCVVSGIPKHIYLGIKETGLGGSTADETRYFYDDIKSNEQEHTTRPNLQRLLEMVQLSLFDVIDPKIGFEFEDLEEVPEKEQAEIDKLEAETDAILIGAGSISNDESRERLANQEGGAYHGLTGPAPEPEPDEDADPTMDAAWSEADHPRDMMGRFGVGSHKPADLTPSGNFAAHKDADGGMHAIHVPTGLPLGRGFSHLTIKTKRAVVEGMASVEAQLTPEQTEGIKNGDVEALKALRALMRSTFSHSWSG